MTNKWTLEDRINIYCDESRVENPDSQYMVIGALFIPRNQKKIVESTVREICQEFHFKHEIKWTKTGNKFFDFYQRLIDYFILNDDMKYRCIVVDKKVIDYERFHNNDEELAFFKFYYLMLKQRLMDRKQYYVFLDKKPTRDQNRARALHSYLKSFILLCRQACSIKHLQAYHSHDILLLQIADYLTGLVAYNINNLDEQDTNKSKIANFLKHKLNKETFLVSSALSEEKFNCFVWNPR